MPDPSAAGGVVLGRTHLAACLVFLYPLGVAPRGPAGGDRWFLSIKSFESTQLLGNIYLIRP